MMELIHEAGIIELDPIDKEQLVGLKQIIEKYLTSNTNQDIREYLEKVKRNDELLVCYIRGRKHDVDYAWKTLQRYTEARFKYYPELFPNIPTSPNVSTRHLLQINCFGILKSRDKFGRRIGFVDMSNWSADLFSMEEFIRAGIFFAENFWKRPEVLKNGIIFIENVKGFNLSVAKHHTIPSVMKLCNLLLCYPVSFQGLYYFNLPFIFQMCARMTKQLFPKKIRERMLSFYPNQSLAEFHEICSPDILPKWAGGKLSIAEAAEDYQFYKNFELFQED